MFSRIYTFKNTIILSTLSTNKMTQFLFCLLVSKLLVFLLLPIVKQPVNACGEPLKRVCYYTTWGGVLPQPELCTHLIYSFASIENGMLSGVWSNPFKELKQKNSNLKLMVAVGGWSFGVQRMTDMLKNENDRKKS